MRGVGLPLATGASNAVAASASTAAPMMRVLGVGVPLSIASSFAFGRLRDRLGSTLGGGGFGVVRARDEPGVKLATQEYARGMQWARLTDVPDDEVRRVLSIARRRTFARGEVVFHEHDPADSLHLVAKGRFAIRITTPLGDSALLGLRGPGESFGELALVSSPDAVRPATVSALEPSEPHAVYRREFDMLRREHPRVGEVLVALLADAVRRTNDLLLDAYYAPAETRVLRRLVDLTTVFANAEVRLTQEDLA